MIALMVESSRAERQRIPSTVDRLIPKDVELNSLYSMHKALDGLDPQTEVQGIVHGFMHLEHMHKQLDVAATLNRPDIVVASRTLRNALQRLSDAGQFDEAMPYEEYIGRLYPDLALTQEECARVAQKLPPETFVSIDKELERIVLLANAIEQGKTQSCCSGHDLTDKPDGDQYLRAYFYWIYTDSRFASALKENSELLSFLDEWDQKSIGKPYTRPDDPYPVPTYGDSFDYPTQQQRAKYNAAGPDERRAGVQRMLSLLEDYLQTCRRMPQAVSDRN